MTLKIGKLNKLSEGSSLGANFFIGKGINSSNGFQLNFRFAVPIPPNREFLTISF